MKPRTIFLGMGVAVATTYIVAKIGITPRGPTPLWNIGDTLLCTEGYVFIVDKMRSGDTWQYHIYEGTPDNPLQDLWWWTEEAILESMQCQLVEV